MIKILHSVLGTLIKIIYGLTKKNKSLCDEDRLLLNAIRDLLISIDEKI